MKLTLTYKDFRKANMFQNHPLRIKIYEEMNMLPTLLGSFLFLNSKIYCIPSISFEALIQKAKNKKKVGTIEVELEEWDFNSVYILRDKTDWYIYGVFRTKESALKWLDEECLSEWEIIQQKLQ